MRILTLSTLFPDASRPVFGPFVERQTLGIAVHPDVELRVVAPIGIPPWPASLVPTYRKFRDVPREEEWKGVKVYRPRFLHLPGGRFDPALEARAVLPLLTRIYREFPFDLIDAEFFFPDGPAAIRLGAAFDVPVSIKSRGSDIHYWGSKAGTGHQLVQASQRAAGLLTVSNALKADMIALGMPEQRIKVHYTGVDLTKFQPINRPAAKTVLNIESPLIVSIGALISRKGHDLVIQALSAVPNATLTIIGQGPEENKLRSLAAEIGVAERVRFAGSLPSESIAQWLGAADVMALASSSEGLANAWVEALACGAPIVITDVGGARELLTDAKGGQVVARDAKSFATAINDLLAHPRPVDEQRAIAERFTWDSNTAALYAHFCSILG